MWISNCKKICHQKPFNIYKTYDFVVKLLKIRPPLPENMVSIIFFLEIEIDSHDQNRQFKNFEKNLSSASVDDEHTYCAEARRAEALLVEYRGKIF